MCHLVLLLPVAGLFVFAVLPPLLAVSIYLVILGASVLLYAAVLQAMRLRVVTGREALIGSLAQVRRTDAGRCLVGVRGELWTARAVGFTEGAPTVGERVAVVAVQGNRLVVAPARGG
ncbi:MAG: hypothetical protein Kow00122_20510 [Thermoleophilia bacterium]